MPPRVDPRTVTPRSLPGLVHDLIVYFGAGHRGPEDLRVTFVQSPIRREHHVDDFIVRELLAETGAEAVGESRGVQGTARELQGRRLRG